MSLHSSASIEVHVIQPRQECDTGQTDRREVGRVQVLERRLEVHAEFGITPDGVGETGKQAALLDHPQHIEIAQQQDNADGDLREQRRRVIRSRQLVLLRNKTLEQGPSPPVPTGHTSV